MSDSQLRHVCKHSQDWQLLELLKVLLIMTVVSLFFVIDVNLCEAFSSTVAALWLHTTL